MGGGGVHLLPVHPPGSAPEMLPLTNLHIRSCGDITCTIAHVMHHLELLCFTVHIWGP